MTATGQHCGTGYQDPPILLAEGARTAHALQPCSVCGRTILPGRDRIADRADGQGVIHVGCCRKLAGLAS